MSIIKAIKVQCILLEESVGPVPPGRRSPEGSSLYVLARQPDVDALLQQRAEGHVLPQGPVHRPVPNHLGPALQDAAQTWKSKSWSGGGANPAIRPSCYHQVPPEVLVVRCEAAALKALNVNTRHQRKALQRRKH